MQKQLGKAYEPETFEERIYAQWEKDGCFEAADSNVPGQKAYCIVIPPPNVTGVLHMGHALGYTIEDILIRWKRMSGYNTLWLPGTDHAGIATQTLVEKQIAKEGKGPTGRPLSRHDLGREKFLKRVWQWKEEHGSKITAQLRRLGASPDWNRERFTLDGGLNLAVREVFVRLYEQGLIYRGERIINWCPRCQTALSDLEVIPTDRKGSFWHIRYPVEGSRTGEALIVATTRPETLLGDTAVCVHPDDERYRHLHGKRVRLPLLNRSIPIIVDEYVDKEFGSGALKITPSHDFNDYDLGKKHGLELVSVIGKEGKMTAEAGPYQGLKVKEAREKICEDLNQNGLLVKVEDHAHKVGLCQRCDTTAEPMISKQWFVKIDPLAKPAIKAVEDGRIEFSPKSWEKTYFEWMVNIRDWCISRQLWWGHQIPAWYCSQCDNITVSRETPKACTGCGTGSENLKQDEDVLDTWFSSALWPFSTLGWPEKTKTLETFYPTSVMETGFDIIFFWVARMIMMGLHFMDGKVPFHKVYLHAMVRDEKGEKMSKSKGNVVDPLEIIHRHGVDPLRFTLAAMAGQGRDIKLSVDRVEGYRGFCNKIFNAVKYFHLQWDQRAAENSMFEEPKEGTEKNLEGWVLKNASILSPVNQWILSRLQHMLTEVKSGLEGFELDRSAQAIYQFAWLELCDWYIEFSKLSFKRVDGTILDGYTDQNRDETLLVLRYTLEVLLKATHPFMPHVTEELWQSLPWIKSSNSPYRIQQKRPGVLTIMFHTYPEPTETLRNLTSERKMGQIQKVIEAIRNFRGENNISPKTEFPLKYSTAVPEAMDFITQFGPMIQSLAKVSELKFVSSGSIMPTGPESVIPLINPHIELRISLKGLVNVEEEKKRLQKEIEKVESDIEHVARKLSQDTFLSKAPPELVSKERKRQEELEAKKSELFLAISKLDLLK